MMVMPWERYQNTEEVSLKPWERYQDVSQLESGLRGAAQGLAMEWADEGIAKGRSVLTDVPYEQALQEERAKFKRAEEANPYTYRAGLVGGSVAPMFIPGGAVGTAIKNAPILTGIASGAISGYGANEVEGKGLEDAGYGALVGGGVGIGAKVLGNAISPKYWKETADSRALAQLGGGVAGIRRANPRNPAKAIDRALKVGERARTEGILSTDTQKMVSDFTKMSDESGETIGRILKDTDTQGLANIDVPSLGSQLDDVTSGVYQGMPYYENLKRVLSPKNKEFYTLEEAQAIKKRLGDLAGYSKGGGDTIEKSMARNAYDIINQSLEDAVERGQSTVGNKEQLYEYLAAKKRYGDAKIGSRMASTKAIRELGNKREFGLTDSIFAAQAASNPIVGAGMYGVKKGWEEYGNIGLSNFAGAMSKATSVNPLSLGKAAPMVQTSISRVGSALSQYPYEEMSKEDSIAHYIRSQRDPEYAQRIEDEKKKIEQPSYVGLGEDLGNIVDNFLMTDKVGLDPQEQENAGFRYGEGVPQPASIKPFSFKKLFPSKSAVGSEIKQLPRYVHEGNQYRIIQEGPSRKSILSNELTPSESIIANKMNAEGMIPAGWDAINFMKGEGAVATKGGIPDIAYARTPEATKHEHIHHQIYNLNKKFPKSSDAMDWFYRTKAREYGVPVDVITSKMHGPDEFMPLIGDVLENYDVRTKYFGDIASPNARRERQHIQKIRKFYNDMASMAQNMTEEDLRDIHKKYLYRDRSKGDR